MQKLLFLLLLAVYSHIPAQTRIYVHASASGNNTGQSWTNAYTSLQTALQIAMAGDTVWVAEGVYRPTETTSRNLSFEPKSGVCLLGGFVGIEDNAVLRDWVTHPTVLSGDIGTVGDSTDNSYNVMYLQFPDSSTVLDGFIIRDGVANGPVTSIYGRGRCGGGLYINGEDWEAYPNIRNCTFVHNTARNFGGGAMINGIGDGSIAPSFQNCIFEQNVSLSNGGGVARYGGSWVERADFNSCIFRRNISKASGAGAYYYDSERSDRLDFERCSFISNQAAQSAGGIFLNLGRTQNAQVRIKNCRFEKNSANSNGIAISLLPANLSSPTHLIQIDSCNFFGNRDPSSSDASLIHIDQFGDPSSAIYIENLSASENVLKGGYMLLCGFSNVGKISIKNSNFIENLYAELYTISSADSLIIENVLFYKNIGKFLSTMFSHVYLNTIIYNQCIIEKNMTSKFIFSNGGVGAIYIKNCLLKDNMFAGTSGGGNISPSLMFFENSILLGVYKKASIGGFAQNVVFRHCAFDSLNCAAFPSNVTCGPNNLIGLAPLFIAPDSGDYRLQPCSPLVNAGNNAYLSALNTTDLAGQPRIQGGTVDIGAYETAAPLLAALPAVQPACSNQPNGGVNISVAGGCAPFSYQWVTASGQSGSGTSGLKSGAYTFTVSDQRGSTFTVSLAVPDSSTVALSSVTISVQCGDSLGGTAIARATGGQPPYLFDWPGSVVMDSLHTNLPPGLYSVTVQDARGCTASAVAEVKKQGNLGSKVEVGPISCFSAADGSLTVLPANGKPPYHWNWQENPALDAPTLAPLGPGAYRVTLTDAYGCDIAWTLPLTQPDSLQVLQSVIDPATDSMSADGSVSVTVAGGTTPYTAQWSNGSTGLSISGLKPNVYTLTLTDQNGCSFTASYVVDVVSGTSEPGRLAGFSVLPNPTEAYLQILLTEPAETERLLSVLDAAGRLAGQWKLPEETQQLRLDLGDLPAGMYWVQLRSERGTATRRVVKR